MPCGAGQMMPQYRPQRQQGQMQNQMLAPQQSELMPSATLGSSQDTGPSVTAPQPMQAQDPSQASTVAPTVPQPMMVPPGYPQRQNRKSSPMGA